MPRFFVPEVPMHVIVRGNNRMSIFGSDADRQFFRAWLRHVAQRHGVGVHAYVLMTNHIHLLVTPTADTGVPRMMHAALLVYARYFNDLYLRTGTLWEGRYRAMVVDSETYLLTCMRYIEQNPVRAGMVLDAAQFPWSSFHANANGATDALVTPHATYVALGDDAAARCLAYRSMLAALVDRADLERIRDATHHGWALGSRAFCDHVDRLSRRSARMPLGRPCRASGKSRT